MGFFSKHVSTELSLLVHIESGSVGAAFVEKKKNGPPAVLYSTREYVAFEKTLRGESLTGAMMGALRRALARAETDGLRNLDRSGASRFRVAEGAVFLASPWHLSEIKTLRFISDKPHVVTEAAIGELLSREEREFEAEKERGSEDSPPRELIERKVIRFTLNGYSTDHPYGKSVRETEVTAFISVAPQALLQGVRGVVGGLFHTEASFHSFSLAAYAATHDISHDSDLLFVHVGGEVTEMLVLKRGVMREMVSFPKGRREILRALEKRVVGSPYAALESLLALVREGRASARERTRVEAALADVKKSWLESLQSALTEHSREVFFPKQIIMPESALSDKVFAGFIADVELNRFNSAPKKSEVTLLDAASERFAQSAGTDTILAMEADFLSRLASSHSER